MRDTEAVAYAAMSFAAAIIVSGAIAVFAAYNEARAYNRITGAHVTTWDAIFVELRIDNPPQHTPPASNH